MVVVWAWFMDLVWLGDDAITEFSNVVAVLDGDSTCGIHRQ
jgi:hypothetical protein